ncbi:MAG: response regulator transcription factor [Firmicutes bacterium]|jgi:two-component system response regulator ResD|nr:response regulator transcription factor [Bacillota bacterium]HPU01084.1 response regulator transcription factor [Bacillota bacterium]
MPEILVIEDDPHILALLRACLTREGYMVTTEENGSKGLSRALEKKFDLIILDLMLPDKDGFEICRELLAAENDTPILILTARGDEMDRVLGLRLGADDYVVKPFSPRELVARVGAILRRINKARSTPRPMLSFPGLEINPENRMVKVNKKKIALTPKEFDLLYQLASRPGRVYTREELMDLVWGYDYTGSSRTIDEHVKNLRQKLREGGATGQCIQTVWGVGYKFEEEEEAQ